MLPFFSDSGGKAKVRIEANFKHLARVEESEVGLIVYDQLDMWSWSTTIDGASVTINKPLVQVLTTYALDRTFTETTGRNNFKTNILLQNVSKNCKWQICGIRVSLY